jgi:transposase-like protein
MRPGARLSEVARRYGIAERILFRWKQEMMPAVAPTFVAVEITDADQERAFGITLFRSDHQVAADPVDF